LVLKKFIILVISASVAEIIFMLGKFPENKFIKNALGNIRSKRINFQNFSKAKAEHVEAYRRPSHGLLTGTWHDYTNADKLSSKQERVEIDDKETR
jgi:hypothetical protein